MCSRILRWIIGIGLVLLILGFGIMFVLVATGPRM